MKVMVGGVEYEIGGIGFGTLPAWKFIKQEGKPMTHGSFDKLPDLDKRELFEHVQQHLNSLKGG
jgi:hypothetical protein